MLSITVTDQINLIAFWLVFARWVTIMFQLPLFDNTAVPPLLKVLTSLMISYAFFPFVQHEVIKDIQFFGMNNFWIMTAYYTIIGLAIGFLVKVIMSVFISAGSIITQQIGFAAVRYFDPNSGQQIGPFEKLIQWTMLVIIISSGALIPMFKGGFSSFSTIHAYNFGKLGASPEFYLMQFKSIFLSALMLASPLIFINILIMSVLGIIARTVPQMNIIMVSFVMNIGLGLLVFAASSDEFFQVAFKIYTEKLGNWFQLLV